MTKMNALKTAETTRDKDQRRRDDDKALFTKYGDDYDHQHDNNNNNNNNLRIWPRVN